MLYLIVSILPALVLRFEHSESAKFTCVLVMASLYLAPLLLFVVFIIFNHCIKAKPGELVYNDPHVGLKHIDEKWKHWKMMR